MIHNKEAENQPTIQDLPPGDDAQKPVKKYVKPAVLTHSGEDVLDELGPAQACYPYGGDY